MPTRGPVKANAGPLSSWTGPLDQGRFLPGTVLAGRYRIFGLLGKGGMGEVYRADDLKLGQAVALKFLPEAVEKDGSRLSRFLNEVKIARQISHPNVCRVYDVGEVEGHHFLSMEYVDGEDLASLLRRIGRLPEGKAVQIARQLCAGLAAAHEQGVLHRDLKPANVMIDGRGRTRITDFGLAGTAERIIGADVRAGTPAYMAPEQLAGKEVSVRSDLYSLGLVLYELFTGQKAFKAATVAELARLQRETSPSTPSSLIEGFDPAAERIILRCLQVEPSDRPASASSVAAALPGGDPLAAAVAAGETPSPELVAQAGEVGGLSPLAAWACAAGIVLGVVAAIMLAGSTQLSRVAPLEKPPEYLIERARDITRRLGHQATPADSAAGFELNSSYIDHIAASDPSPGRWRRLETGPPYAIYFWYCLSSRSIAPFDVFADEPQWDDPPALVSGMVRLYLDPTGRLSRFESVPPERDDSRGPFAEPDWTALFVEAGLDADRFRRVEPLWSPPAYADARVAWEGTYPGVDGPAIRVEAAAYHGMPTFFRILDPWTRPTQAEVVEENPWGRFADAVSLAMTVGVFLGSALIARRNVRLGRGDRRAAARLAIFVLAVLLLGWLFTAHHVLAWSETANFCANLAFNLFISCLVWIFYLAVEPYLRRLWPQVLISWVRLLDGRFGDPLIGRDVVLGMLAGLLFSLIRRLHQIDQVSLGVSFPRPDMSGPPLVLQLWALMGLFHSLGIFVESLAASLLFPLMTTTLVVLCRVLLRRQWPAMLGALVLMTVSHAPTSDNLFLSLAYGVVVAAIYLLIFFRLGLLPLVIASLVSIWLAGFPLTLDFSSWYAGNGVIVLAAFAALAAFGLRTSLAGQPMFKDVLELR